MATFIGGIFVVLITVITAVALLEFGSNPERRCAAWCGDHGMAQYIGAAPGTPEKCECK